MNAIPYGKQNITQADIDAVVETLQSEFLTQGPKIAEFEAAFAEYVGSKYAVAVSNGTAALHLCAMVMDVKPGDKVITTPITFAASANCVKYCGGDVVFADINPDTFLIDIESVRSLLEKSPAGTYKGIIPVDLAGLSTQLDEFRKLADDHNLWIIEDACHAPGGYFKDSNGKKQFCGNGKFAELSIFLFHPVKHITSGEGGMVTTNNEEFYKRLLLLRTHGITKDPALMEKNDGGWYYEMVELGYNYRICDIQAALGLSQLKRADEGLQRRRDIAKKYNEAFAPYKNKIKTPVDSEGHAYHLYVIQTEDRLGLYNFLRSNKIFAQVHYVPVYSHPYYQQFGYKKKDYPASENYYNKCLSLPMYPTLTDKEQEFVIDNVLKHING